MIRSSSREATPRTATALVLFTTDPLRAAPLPGPAAAERFAAAAAEKHGGTWEKVMSKRICVSAQVPGSAVHYYATEASLAPVAEDAC
jgi:hypothetical protein